MKKWTLFLSLMACLCLLTGCASEDSARSESETNSNTTQPVTTAMTCRIIATEHDQLLLAKQDGGYGDVYTVPLGSTVFTVDGEPIDLQEPGAYMDLPNQTLDGALAVISYDGSIMESFPAQFSQGTAVDILTSGFDDRCALYLEVLEDLWDVDSGLNGGVEVIGVDLSQTSLTPAEQAAVGWAFAGNHDAELVEGSLEELMEQDWITASPLMVCGSEEEPGEPQHYFYEWENGCHFSITEQPMEGTYSLTPVTFDAQKWRSSLGAYWFCDCTAVQSALGQWGDYQIGAEMIS